MSKAKCSSENPATCRYHGHEAQVATATEMKKKAEDNNDFEGYFTAKKALESLEKLRQSQSLSTEEVTTFTEYSKALETADNFRKEAATRAADYISAEGTDRGAFHVFQSDDSKGGYYIAFSEDHNFEERGYERMVPVTLHPWNRTGRPEKVNLPADVIQGNYGSKASGKNPLRNTVTFAGYSKALETADNFRKEAAIRAAAYVSSHTAFLIDQSDGSKGGYRVTFNEDHSFEARGYERTIPVTLVPWNPTGRKERLDLPADIIQGK